MNRLLFNILDYSSDYFMYSNLYTLQLFSNENKVFVTDGSSSKCFKKTYHSRLPSRLPQIDQHAFHHAHNYD